MPEGQRLIYRFGVFEVDPLARTLKRSDSAVSLSRRAFDLLLYLVQNSGRILPKEELLRNIWPDTHVDENSLAKTISVLRKALDENPLESTIVVTLPGRGYQFAAPVEIAGNGEAANVELMAGGRPSSGGLLFQQRTIQTSITEEKEVRLRTTPLGWLVVSLAAVIVLSVAAGAGLLVWRHFHPAPHSASVVLADFENTTGDSDFDYALNRGLQIDLEQSPFLDVLPNVTIKETLVQMQHKADEPLTPELAREVCERNNAQAVLNGAISKFGDRYLLIVNAASCVTGKNVAAYKEQISSKSDVLPALDAAAGHVRKQLGESAASLEKFQTPIAQATTSSLEALRAYTQAMEASDRGDPVAEQALFQRAIALDPKFASAYRGLSICFHNRQDFVQAAAQIQIAWSLRAQTTERERLAIEIAYNTYGTGDWEAAIGSLRLYNQIYPNDASNWFALCLMYSRLGEYAQAIEAGQQGYRLAPHSGTGAETLARAYLRANRFSDAKRVAEAALADGKGRWGTHRILFQIAYIQQDAATMKTEGQWGFTHGEMGQSLTDLGFVAASEGKVREAADDFNRTRREAIRAGDADFADYASMFLAGIMIEFGYPREAAAALKQMRTDAMDPGTTAAFMADLGDLEPARRQIAKLSSSDTRSTLSLYFDLPMLRALLDIKAHKPEQAIQDLEPSRIYQMREDGVPYLRAHAETDAGLLDKAVEDYRLILDNPGLDPIWPDHSITHLRLARVLARQHKLVEARREYQVFLNLWKDGDPQVPLLVQARQEYTKLPPQ